MFDLLAERKIEEALANGELDDDSLIPEDLRAAYRILKNAGYVPPEVHHLREIAALEQLVLQGCSHAETQGKALKKLALLRTSIERAYCDKAIARLSR